MWTRLRVGVLTAVFFCSVAVPPVSAQVVPSSVLETPVQNLTLDQGFMGRPVSMGLFHGALTLSWGSDGLSAPSFLTVTQEDIATSSQDGIALDGTSWHIAFPDPSQAHLTTFAATLVGCTQSAWDDCRLFRLTDGNWAIDGNATTTAQGFLTTTLHGDAVLRIGRVHSAFMKFGDASWYKYKSCRCAASVDFPKGTHLRVRLMSNPMKYTVIRVNDYGPERDKFPKRAIDLDAVAFKELAPLGAGVLQVTVEPVAKTDPDYAIADKLPPQPAKKTTAVKPKAVKTVSTVDKKAWDY